MSNSLQTLQPEIVCQITEALMLTHGTTTTLEVKKELREQGFFAVQEEVSALMAGLAEERNWKFWSNGRFRVYSFAEDTDERLYHYLKKDDKSWEILVDGKWQVVSEGNAARTTPCNYQEFPSNRHAIAHAAGLLMIQESKGYVPTMPRGLNLQHRYRYREFIRQHPVSCVLSFRQGLQNEIYPAKFQLHDQVAHGALTVHRRVGYAFDLLREDARAFALPAREVNAWKVADELFEKGFFLGEAQVSESATLASGERMGRWNLLEADEAAKRTELHLKTSGIYKAEFYYKNDRRIELSYENWQPETELWPMVCLLLGIVADS
ncbi:hypothetical protein [Flavilitoribacter nigricans]|uniref:Uncharacterized protein n=1 Tax=Flavilitoribacter nigricans (strain ATCC 23147 / DSM 23189 / NBRC 102662 / NCIMB 1420 / SS-2) TaxID=1122177 RepID=A0A2D0N514_FLAN2|nr:hypothetical protein [Flavilitoribacter nigricans]PHN03249.1 hypothetical protein CRP01_28050 [Flavilitoribacter nigricans DSM 23189 = NBRC 102662]